MLPAILAAVATYLLVPAPAGLRLSSRGVVVPSDARGPRSIPDLSSPGVAAALTFVGVVTFLGVWPGAVVGLLAAAGMGRAVGRLESRADRERREVMSAALPHAVDLMVAALDAGRPQVQVLRLVGSAVRGPLGAELDAIGRRLDSAGDPVAVWSDLRDDPLLGALARAFVRASTSGASVTRVLGRVGHDLRRVHRARTQERARSVAVRTAAPLGLCFLPAFVAIGIVPMLIATFGELQL